jgi:hypothetical protein
MLYKFTKEFYITIIQETHKQEVIYAKLKNDLD